DNLPEGSDVRLTDGSQLLAETDPALAGGRTERVSVAGQEWTVQVRHPRRVSFSNIAWISAVGFGLAILVGAALHRSERHVRLLAASRGQLAGVVSAVQQAALRPPDVPDHIEATVRYEPAAEHARLGGDWYDIFTRPDGHVVISVGDASGHGVQAITHMQR